MKRLICGQDRIQAEACGRPQGFHQGQALIELLCQEGGFRPFPRVDASTVSWCVSHGVTPPPVKDGSREGFHIKTFLTSASRGREALKCALPQNTQQQSCSPLIRVWLRVLIPSVLPFPLATASHI